MHWIEGCVEFDSDIVGVITSDDNLDATDNLFKMNNIPIANYNTNLARGLEDNYDVVRIEPTSIINDRMVCLSLAASDLGDGFRVLTKNSRNTSPDVEITKQIVPKDGPYNPGDIITYTVTALNIGTANATDVTVKDVFNEIDLTQDAEFYPVDGTSFDNSNNLWSIGTLEPGEDSTLEIKLELPSEPCSYKLENNAGLYKFEDSNSENDRDSVTVEIDCKPIPTPNSVADEEILLKDLRFTAAVDNYVAIMTPPQNTFLKEISCHIEDSDAWAAGEDAVMETFARHSDKPELEKTTFLECGDDSAISQFKFPMVYLPPNTEFVVNTNDGGYYAVDVWLQIEVGQDLEKFDSNAIENSNDDIRKESSVTDTKKQNTKPWYQFW